MNSLEKINNEYGARIRGTYGEKRGNDIIRQIAEERDHCKYPLFGR